jgi:hypothetical protein
MYRSEKTPFDSAVYRPISHPNPEQLTTRYDTIARLGERSDLQIPMSICRFAPYIGAK